MLDWAGYLRAAVAEIIARNFGIDHNVYLNYNNYRDSVSSNPKFSLKAVLSTLHNNVYSGKDPHKILSRTIWSYSALDLGKRNIFQYSH